MFKDRTDAGRKLAKKLRQYKGDNLVVLALPRGGVLVGYQIAKALSAPLDVLLVRKLGSPINPELGIGAIAQGGIKVLDEAAINQMGIKEEEIEKIEKKEKKELERRAAKYRVKAPLPEISNKIVILADDGLATGVTAMAAIRAVLIQVPKKLVVALPVCAQGSVTNLLSPLREEDKLVCLLTPHNFSSVGSWYKNFPQVSDEEVLQILNTVWGG